MRLLLIEELQHILLSHTDPKNIEDLQAQLNTISMTNLMGGDDASWMFNEVINFARDNHPNDPRFQEGGADRSITTDRDNLFQIDASTGNLVSIPWISDQTVLHFHNILVLGHIMMHRHYSKKFLKNMHKNGC